MTIVEIHAPEMLHEFLLQHAATRPGAPAVIEQSRTTSYGELRERAEAYAAALAGLGLGIGHRVVVDADTSAPAIAMLIACSMRGLTYIPVSPETPTPRVLSVAAAAGAVLHLQTTEGERTGLPPELGAGRFGPDSLEVTHLPAIAPTGRTACTPVDPAYIVFTSGTTGRPKGVVMSHRAVLSFFRGMLAHRIVGPDDRVATTSPLQFDFSLLDIGLALGSGAAVLPVPRPFLRWPRRFLSFLAATGATQVNGVPSIWRPVLRHEPDQLGTLTALRGVLYSGEPFPLPELRQLRKLRPGLRIVNCYGSTESIACSFTDVPDPVPDSGDGVPIGPAHPGAELLLLGEDGRPVSGAGVLGELYLRSPALFSGYWDDPATTGRVLVPDPVEPRSGQLVYRTGDLATRGGDGLFYYSCRADSQVKIRGNRVELGEVERRLLDLPGVGAATVLAPPRPDGEPVLCAFLAVAAEAGLTEARVSAFCKETLPDYMIPSEVRLLGELPVTVNGKVDKAALLAGRE
ncbi:MULTISPECIES: AMP-binding protein [unclassified Actinoplanes]|uniref:AMP-binding protein n=1 Tax=unclassified Actinoplanes TaxID=2626549 RepID=UPI0005BE10A6|nr:MULTISPECIES: AMP-binding protein [unclassified Actinoplanes]